MELKIEQAIQQGVTAHKNGKLQKAERLYRAILQSQPAHPDANHNLGLIAVSVNKADVALTLFKAALEANPKIEQFWLSYIDTLIKEKQFDNAKRVLEQGKKQGVTGEKINFLKEHLTLITKKPKTKLSEQKKSLTLLEKRKKSNKQKNQKEAKIQNLKATSPSETEIKRLLHNYQNGLFSDAEKLALSITQEFPKHQFSWKVLGAVLKQTGRVSESLAASQKSVQLVPQDAEAHNNLGNTFKELGRLEEAEASYKQAIDLKPDYAVVHNNLGITLKELGRLDEVEASYAQAISLKPDYAEAHYNLGITLNELGRLDEAAASYTQAIWLKPNYPESHNNLGITLKELGRLDEAAASYTQAIELKPDFAEAMLNLSNALVYMGPMEEKIRTLQNVLQIDSDNYGLMAGVNLAICKFLEGDFLDSRKHLLAAAKIQEKTSLKFKSEKVYQKYLLNILRWHEEKYFHGYKTKTDRTLYAIGESHSLVSHQLPVQGAGSVMLCQAKLIKGCKQFHLGNSNKNQYKTQFESIFCSLPKASEVLLAIGEIDCRLNSGIIKYKNKFPEKELKEIIVTTVENYLTYILENNSEYQHNIIIQGVPCPNIDTESHSGKNVAELIDVIKIVNFELKSRSNEKGFDFLDVHKLTDRGDGFSNAIWHIDDYHLSPDGIQEAWRRYAAEYSYL